MSELVTRLRSRLFARTPRDRDAYHAEIAERVRPGMLVLDLGCGKGLLNPFPWSSHPDVEVVGLDPDPEAKSNPALSEFHLLEEGRGWPVEDDRFDLVVCRYVLEHVADPPDFLHETNRVLKTGGRFVFLTPSRYYPVMLVSHFLPHRLHQRILARTKKSAANDVFATHYKMNSKRALRRQASENGFDIEALVQRDFQPTDYFDFNVVVFSLHLVYHWFCKLTRLDRSIGATLLGVFAKHGRVDERPSA